MLKLTFHLVLFILIPLSVFSQGKGLNLKFEKAARFHFEEFETAKSKISLTEEEFKLFNLINEYRKEYNKPEIPLSKSLTFVAQTHAQDLKFNVNEGSRCNLHSWSKKGPWTNCCYKSDHSKAGCMWNKPRELTSYNFNGYEIVYFHSWDPTADDAINHWKESSAHNPVLLNINNWEEETWQAIGIGIYEEYAVVWFGKKPDSEGEPILPETN